MQDFIYSFMNDYNRFDSQTLKLSFQIMIDVVLLEASNDNVSMNHPPPHASMNCSRVQQMG